MDPRKFVENHVIANVTTMVNELGKVEDSIWSNEIYELLNPTYEKVDDDQYRYIVHNEEQINFSASFYEILENGEDSEKSIFEVTTQHLELFNSRGLEYDVNDGESMQQALYNADLIGGHWYTVINEDEEPNTTTEIKDIHEYYIVSDFLADRLANEGETVAINFMGMNVWGRGATGQAVKMDCVIQKIAATVD